MQMTPENFCYWLQGYFELQEEMKDGRGLGAGQAQTIQKHLQLVFTPVMQQIDRYPVAKSSPNPGDSVPCTSLKEALYAMSKMINTGSRDDAKRVLFKHGLAVTLGSPKYIDGDLP